MLDIEYLLNPVPITTHVVYRFRTGVLQHRLRRAIESVTKPLASYDGLTSFEAFASGDGFFQDQFTPFIHLSKTTDPCIRLANSNAAPNRIPRSVRAGLLVTSLSLPQQASRASRKSDFTDRLAASLKEHAYLPIIIFARADSALFDTKDLASYCLVIDEACVGGAEIDRFLRFMERSSDVIDRFFASSWVQLRKSLDQHLRDCLQSRTSMPLTEAMHEFDRYVLIYSHDNTFGSAEAHFSSQIKTTNGLTDAVRHFLIERDTNSLTPLLGMLGALAQNGYSARRLFDQVANATWRCLRGASHSSKLTPDLAIVWTCLIAIFGTRLILAEERDDATATGIQTLTVDLGQMLDEYMIRNAPDPLHGLWSEIRLFLSNRSESPTGPFERLVYHLPQLAAQMDCQEGWVRRLLAMSERRQIVEASQLASAIALAPAHLHDLIGNRKLLSELRDRFYNNNHNRPLILHGPSGSGKRTIGKVYSRVFLCCERPAHSDLPCDRCSSAALLDNIGYIEFDASLDTANNLARTIWADVGNSFLSDRQVIAIRNADLSESSLAVFLAELEEQRPNVVIILYAEQVGSISDAVRSRCAVHQVQPLDYDDAKQMLEAFLGPCEYSRLEASAISLAIAAAEGRPREIARIASIILENSVYSLHDLASALDFAWMRWALGYWHRLLSFAPLSPEDIALPTSMHPDLALSHLTDVLSALRSPSIMPRQLQIILREEHSRLFEIVSDCLKIRAIRSETTAEHFWGLLAREWSRASIWDASSFLKAAIVLRHSMDRLRAVGTGSAIVLS